MNIRKVVRVGHSQMVALPWDWVVHQKEQGGPFDRVQVEVRGEALLIRPFRRGGAGVEVMNGAGVAVAGSLNALP